MEHVYLVLFNYNCYINSRCSFLVFVSIHNICWFWISCIEVMHTFFWFCRVTNLVHKQFQCFKYCRNEWYKFSGNEWVPMFTSEIDGFVLWVYNRLESVARQIDKDLTSEYTLIDITNQTIVLKRASME